MTNRILPLVLASFSLVTACNKANSGTSSGLDSAHVADKPAPRIARCSQTSEVQNITVRETVLIQVVGDVVSGSYHYAHGQDNALTDSGFEHLLGRIDASESKNDLMSLKLKDGSLNVFFDEEFAPSKTLKEIRFDLKERRVSFFVSDDARGTTIGNCSFE
ncbi:hypothetical protein EBU99_05970 [bacterium]|nr:hypothetical protein [bacterium]